MTNAELAILGLVAEQPRHGYDIEQVIQERGMREWTEVGFSSIYYLLNKLEKKGLIAGKIGRRKTGRGPAPKIFQLTTAGRASLHQAVLAALSIPQRCYLPIQLGLANFPLLADGEALAALRQYRESLADRRDHVQARAKKQQPLPVYVGAMFNHSLALIEAELEWVETFIKQLEKNHA